VDIEELAITRDGKFMSVVTNEDGYVRVSILSIGESLQPCASDSLPTGELSGLNWSYDGSQIAFTRCSFDSSFNVWIWDREKDSVRQITQMPMRVPSSVMVEPELIHYESFDGLSVPAFIYRPSEALSPTPVIVNIHGGPEGQFTPSYTPVIQYMVYNGYTVIAPNVRGSSGYGKAYLALDDRLKRMDSVKDLAWLHRWITADSQTDETKTALYGGSYGGYMVLAGLAFQPKLWAAGVDIVGISNLVTFLENTSSWRRAIREAEYGYLATDREFLESASPLNKVDDIQAPLIIIHGSNDPRVPLSEAHQLHEALALKDVQTQLLVYTDEGHGLSKLKNRLDAYPQVMQFLDSILK
jgi:dipeptidyl aminopeptidase/acylaminoacyl peptidase